VPTGRERFFDTDEIIVSKTDPKGIITYANRVFLRVSDYTEEELIGKSHNIIRHPDMPRCVFKLLWDTLLAGREMFAYVKNLSKNGDHYWVHAHVTPTRDSSGKIIGFHSNRRVPGRMAVAKMESLYQDLLRIENSRGDWREGMAAATEALSATLNELGMPYDEFVFSLED
jgi:PAS domain S-box-containing protein